MWAGCVGLHQALCLHVQKDTRVFIHGDREGAHVPHAWDVEVEAPEGGTEACT